MLAGCFAAPPQNETTDNGQSEPSAGATSSDQEEASGDESPSAQPSGTFFPAEITDPFKGHEVSIADNPLIGTYTTTSGCTMILMADGRYSWQDTPQATPITGTYEIYEGTFSGGMDEDHFVLESDTGPLYTVFVTFDAGQAAADGTIQVFDYQSDGVYYVTDLMNNIWFEATRTA